MWSKFHLYWTGMNGSGNTTRVVHDALQLREHCTRDEILADHHDGIGLKAMLLRRDRMSGQDRGSENC
jgi:hypothetical protein